MSIFGAKKSSFRQSAAILAEEGFSDGYIEKLREEIAAVKKPVEAVKGQSFLINGLIIKGSLSEAYEIFVQCEESGALSRLDKNLYPNLLHNVIFSLFVRDKFKEAERLYKSYNAEVLLQQTSSMKRTLAIHECINERYENAVTVLIKLLDSDCRFIDICIVKTVLKLDMYERGLELSADFDSYNNKNELTAEAQKLKKKLFYGLSPKDKLKMVKNY